MTLSFDPETDERFAAYVAAVDCGHDKPGPCYLCAAKFATLLDAGLIVDTLPPQPRVERVTLEVTLGPEAPADHVARWSWDSIVKNCPTLSTVTRDNVAVRVVPEGEQP